VENHEESTDEFIENESSPVRMVRQFVHHYQLNNIICLVMSALLTIGSTIFLDMFLSNDLLKEQNTMSNT